MYVMFSLWWGKGPVSESSCAILFKQYINTVQYYNLYRWNFTITVDLYYRSSCRMNDVLVCFECFWFNWYNIWALEQIMYSWECNCVPKMSVVTQCGVDLYNKIQSAQLSRYSQTFLHSSGDLNNRISMRHLTTCSGGNKS